MLTESTPASRNGAASVARRVPLVDTPSDCTPALPRYSRGDLNQILPNTRLAASEPKFSKSKAAGRSSDPNDLVRREVIRFLRPALIALWHAVETALIATVGHRNAQIINHASEAVHRHYYTPPSPRLPEKAHVVGADFALVKQLRPLQTAVLPDRKDEPKAHERPPNEPGQADDGNAADFWREARENENARTNQDGGGENGIGQPICD